MLERSTGSRLKAALWTPILLIFRLSPFLRRHILFMNTMKIQKHRELSKPQSLGLEGAQTLKLTNPDTPGKVVELGIWYIPARSRLKQVTSDTMTWFDGDNRPIVLYVHGNCGNRATEHRVDMYLRLSSEFDMHVVAFDYRGFGESTGGPPSAPGVTSDARFMYNWLLAQSGVNKDRLVVWGHSLGSAIATRLVANLSPQVEPKALILEAPFDNVANAVTYHPWSRPINNNVFFDSLVRNPIERFEDFNFDSTKMVRLIQTTRLLILHAIDDPTIPIELGRNLYHAALEQMGHGRARMVEIDESQGAGHTRIGKHDATMNEARQFIADCLDLVDNRRLL